MSEREQEQYSKILKMFNSGNSSQLQMFLKSFIKDPEPTRYILNCESTQFPIGKTGKTLDTIDLQNMAKQHVLHEGCDENTHNISIIITSCNLQETAQWKFRTDGRLGKTLNITAISSKTKKTKNGSGTNISNFTHALSVLPQNELPNILIMCCHSARVLRDVIQLLKCSNRIVDEFNKQYSYNIFVDEADKNIKMIIKMIKKLHRENLGTYVRQIHFITATPTKDLWIELNKINVKHLENLDLINNKITSEDRIIANTNYQSILTQDVMTVEYNTSDPLEYIDYILKTRKDLINPSKRQILFVPGSFYIESHERISDYFIDKGYWVFMHNGTFKGFIEPYTKEKTTLIEFQIQNNLYDVKRKRAKCELRDCFVLWNKQHPKESLAITSGTTLVRGSTMNTKNFNFTAMIVSHVHARKLNEFVQLLGRASGNKKYCGKIKIISPEKPILLAKEFVTNLLSIKEKNFSKYDSVMFEQNQKNKDVICFGETTKNGEIIYKTKKEVLLEVQNVFGKRCKPKAKKQQNSELFYLNTVRSKTKVWSYKEIYKQRYSGLGSVKYRIHVCYEDINDKNTERWLLCYKKDN